MDIYVTKQLEARGKNINNELIYKYKLKAKKHRFID
jgi:hypothetical protein